MGRILVIGDIHGCVDELRDLLERLAPGAQDRLLLLGDLVDRGPDPAAVVAVVQDLAARMPGRFAVLRGNHEDKHLRLRARQQGHGPTAGHPVQLDPDQVEVHAQVGAQGWDWLAEHAAYFHRLAPGLLGVHAGVLPGNRQWPDRPDDLAALPPDERRLLRTACLYVRDVDQAGHFLPMGKAAQGQRFWAERYDGRFGHVVHGHSPTLGEPRRHRHATGIDTGCVFGGRLTAAVWHGPVPTQRAPDEIVQVPARRVWAEWHGGTPSEA